MAVKQISVFLENRAGRLWELCDILGKNDINMRALSIGESSDFGIVRMIVNDPDAAKQVLTDAGFTATETDVVAVVIPDVPGGLAKVLGVLKDAGRNVEYAYAFVARSEDKAIVSLRVEDVAGAQKALVAADFAVLGPEQVYSL